MSALLHSFSRRKGRLRRLCAVKASRQDYDAVLTERKPLFPGGKEAGPKNRLGKPNRRITPETRSQLPVIPGRQMDRLPKLAMSLFGQIARRRCGQNLHKKSLFL
jgi:hypothetical protein